MSDEIKKILDYLKNNTFIPDETKRKYKILHRDEVNKLLDYITNLQQELDEEKRIEKLEEENERLKNDIEDISCSHFSLFKQYEDYKSRVEKAVELIKKAMIETDITGNGTLNLNELLTILQGGKDE